MEGKNYLMCDDFENELGSPSENVLGEDFSDIARHNIVDVLGMICCFLRKLINFMFLGNDRAGRSLVVVFAYRLPASETIDHQKFLRQDRIEV